MERVEEGSVKPKYRFSHKGDDGNYYWRSVGQVDSRSEQITCSASWFWDTAKKGG